jgi:hypothetical protein
MQQRAPSTVVSSSLARGFARFGLLLSALGAFGPVATAYADGMRCGTRLVSDGDSLYEVRERCGDPEAARQRTELRTVRQYIDGPCFQDRGVLRCGQVVERVIEVVIDEWTYDFGPHQLIRHLTFEQGRLLRVGTGSYGTKTD